MASSPRSRRSLVPYVLLVTALAITAGVARYAHNQIARQDSLRFEDATKRVFAEIDNRLDAYIAMLHGGAGLFAGSQQVEFLEFRAYVERLELGKRYPGVQGVGFSRFVPDRERAHIEQVIRPYKPDFTYWARGPADELHAIIFLEPESKENVYAMGFNMFSEPVRREAMVRARDSGMPAASGPVRLVQDDITRNNHPGFLMYEPVYRTGAVPPAIEERRAQLLGFVYSPFQTDVLLRNIPAPDDAALISYEVYDRSGKEPSLLYSSVPAQPDTGLYRESAMSVAGRDWLVVVRARPALTVHGPPRVDSVLAAVGLALSVLLFGVTRDMVKARIIAERKTEELRASEEALRAANRSKDEFLAIVSHELRTPLNAIVGWGSMLRRGQVPPGSEGHALEVIERNALAQARLVEDLLDISRAVAGRLRLEISEVDLGATLKSAADAVRPAAHAHSVDLQLDLPPDMGIVRGDSARLQQIVQNLLSNAIKFSKPGMTVRLEATRAGKDACIRVIDTGVGISQEFLPFVFDPFRQEDTSTTRAHGGVGLGLAIVRHLVELHGGTIAVTSEGEGLGSTFTVCFRGVYVGAQAATA
jgi:signal transduction histidine kinase